MDDKLRNFLSIELSRPTFCDKCKGIMIYQGVGEYKCEDCGWIDYDDYGKVRSYLEGHRGANVAEISEATGVTHKSIREMIKEKRFEVVENRGGYIRCEICGENISSGRFCQKCEMEYHRKMEDETRKFHKKDLSGISTSVNKEEKGSKRFNRYK